MRVLALSLLACSVAVLPGCQMNERLSGTIMGGVGGAALGGIATSTLGGAVVGGGIGALAGYLIGDYMADQRERGVGMRNRWGATGTGSGSATDTPVAAKAAYEKGRRAATAEGARASYMEAVRLDPARPEPYNALGLSVLASGDKSGARSYFQQSLKVDPTYAPASLNLARLDQTR